MITREQLISEIQNIPERYLEEIYQILKTFESQPEENRESESVMAQLRRIQISAAPDFSIKASIYDMEER